MPAEHPANSYFAGHKACDRCGSTSGVRIRKCTYRVTGHSLNGPRITLPYCAAPALCSACSEELGNDGSLHGETCRAGAEAAHKHAEAVEAQLDAGDSLPVAAWGDGHPYPGVPKGKVGVLFRGRAGDTYRLIHPADYTYRAPLSAVESEPWVNHP